MKSSDARRPPMWNSSTGARSSMIIDPCDFPSKFAARTYRLRQIAVRVVSRNFAFSSYITKLSANRTVGTATDFSLKVGRKRPLRSATFYGFPQRARGQTSTPAEGNRSKNPMTAFVPSRIWLNSSPSGSAPACRQRLSRRLLNQSTHSSLASLISRLIGITSQ